MLIVSEKLKDVFKKTIQEMIRENISEKNVVIGADSKSFMVSTRVIIRDDNLMALDENDFDGVRYILYQRI